jgi:hypothetical protein
VAEVGQDRFTTDPPERAADSPLPAEPEPPAGVHPDDDGRQESLNQRLDRNWIEILQELRVTQTGTQILTGFLLAIAFQSRFESLTPFQVRVYLVLVVIAVLTTALALTPVSLHRSLFRRRAKLVVVRTGHLILRLVLLGVGLTLTGTVLLVFDVVVGRGPALVMGGGTALVLTALGLLPVLLRFARPSRAPADETST